MVTIVTDSSVDLPPALAEKLGIVVAPLSVAFADVNLHDEGLDRAEFYRRLEAAARTPTVTGASADAFAEAFERAQARGGEVVCMVMSVESSFTYVAAEVAVRRFPELKVSIVNSGRSLAAQAALAIAAAEAAQAGAGSEAIVRLIEERSAAADTYLVPAGTEYLRRAGRLQTLGQGPAGKLDGAVPVLRVRGRMTAIAKAPSAEAARARMLELVVSAMNAGAVEGANAAGGEQIVVVTHAVAPELAKELASAVAARVRCRPPVISELGPTVGTYLGPGAVGIGYCLAGAST